MESLASKTIPSREPDLQRRQNAFEANLETCEICRETVPLSFSGFQPMVPAVCFLRPGSLPRRSAEDRYCDRIGRSRRQDQLETAVVEFGRAAELDSLHAGTRFALACCLISRFGSKPTWNTPRHGTMISCVSHEQRFQSADRGDGTHHSGSRRYGGVL
jgi:hypothetical protein